MKNHPKRGMMQAEVTICTRRSGDMICRTHLYCSAEQVEHMEHLCTLLSWNGFTL